MRAECAQSVMPVTRGTIAERKGSVIPVPLCTTTLPTDTAIAARQVDAVFSAP
jgi:hypothetical protein